VYPIKQSSPPPDLRIVLSRASAPCLLAGSIVRYSGATRSAHLAAPTPQMSVILTSSAGLCAGTGVLPGIGTRTVRSLPSKTTSTSTSKGVAVAMASGGARERRRSPVYLRTRRGWQGVDGGVGGVSGVCGARGVFVRAAPEDRDGKVGTAG
jgi:hypothetical protein